MAPLVSTMAGKAPNEMDHLRVAPMMGCDTINRQRIEALLNGVLTVQTKAGGQYYVNLHVYSRM